MDEGDDVALNKPATQSSVSPWSRGGPSEDARGANSGALHPDFGFHTDQQSDPWWQVDLEHDFIVEKICLLNRYNYPQRLRHFSVLGSLDTQHWEVLYQKTDDIVLENPQDLPLVLVGAALARFIRVRLDGDGMLHFRSLQAFGRRAETIDAVAVRQPFAEASLQAMRGLSGIREFCHRHGLDEAIVRKPHLHQKLCIRAIPRREFRGDIKAIRVARQFGRFGNVFYQLLNTFIIARRIKCKDIQLPRFEDASVAALPMLIDDITVTYWPSIEGTEPTLVGCLFAPTGLERFFGDFDSHFSVETVQRCLLPLYQGLLADIPPLGPNVLAMHFRGGDIFAGDDNGHIHGWYVQPPGSYYLTAFDFAQRNLGVDSACLVFEDRSNPAVDSVERELAARGVRYQLQSADLLTDLRCLLAASHVVPSYGTFCEAIALLSAHCESYFGFRRLSSVHETEGFPQSRVDEMLRAMGVRTFLIDDIGDRYTPQKRWTASSEQLNLIRTYPQEMLELNEIGR